MNHQHKIANALLLLRLSVFVVMLMWTLDKFINPDHSAAVYANFYKIGGLGAEIFMLIGALELLLLLAFVTGFKKTISYGLVLIIHSSINVINLATVSGSVQQPAVFCRHPDAGCVLGLVQPARAGYQAELVDSSPLLMSTNSCW